MHLPCTEMQLLPGTLFGSNPRPLLPRSNTCLPSSGHILNSEVQVAKQMPRHVVSQILLLPRCKPCPPSRGPTFASAGQVAKKCLAMWCQRCSRCLARIPALPPEDLFPYLRPRLPNKCLAMRCQRCSWCLALKPALPPEDELSFLRARLPKNASPCGAKGAPTASLENLPSLMRTCCRF